MTSDVVPVSCSVRACGATSSWAVVICARVLRGAGVGFLATKRGAGTGRVGAGVAWTDSTELLWLCLEEVVTVSSTNSTVSSDNNGKNRDIFTGKLNYNYFLCKNIVRLCLFTNRTKIGFCLRG